MSRSALSPLFVLFVAGLAAAQPAAPKPALSAPPVEVIDRLAKSKLVPVEPFAGAERAALTAAWKARSDPKAKPLPQADATAVAAHLLAGGVSDPVAIAKYLKAFDALVVEAKTATRDAKTPREKADALLRFLHKGVMAKGYVAEQSSLHAVFDSGTFNCVSSAALYYLVGTRLGLDLLGLSIPAGFMVAGHAAADLLDGKARVQIEPTNADGFEADVKAKRPSGLIAGPQPDRTRGRDCDGYGLAASAASNLGVTAATADPPRRGEAIRWYAAALALDPANALATNNLFAEFSNWGVRAAKTGAFEEAVAVYAFALGVLGDGEELKNNHAVIWSWYLDAEFAAGRYENGLTVLDRAAKAVPDESSFRNPAKWATRAAETAIDTDGWAAGLAVAEVALKALPKPAAEGIRDWRDTTRRRWSQSLLEKGRVDESVAVIAAGLAADPDSSQLRSGLEYHTVDALAHLAKTKGVPAADAHLAALRMRFPKELKTVNAAAHAHAERAIEKLNDGKKYAESVTAAGEYKEFGADADEMTGIAYHLWARDLATEKKWEDALAKYAEGLKAAKPGERLRNGFERTVDEWADIAIDGKKWDEAIRIYDAGLKVLPDSGHLKYNKSVCEERRGK